MENQMFCFQCEQTAHCTGCTGAAGVCGKKAPTARLQDALTGALIGLAHACDGAAQPTESIYQALIEGLFTTITNVNFDDETITDMIARVHREKNALAPQCCGCGSSAAWVSSEADSSSAPPTSATRRRPDSTACTTSRSSAWARCGPI